MLAFHRVSLQSLAVVVLSSLATLEFLTEARARPASQQTQATISGQVRVAGAEGKMAGSVSVAAIDTATDLQAAYARTDTAGRFVLTVAPGRYLITASHAGFLVSRHGSARYGLPGSPVVIAEGEVIDVQLLLERASVISGVVRDDRGTAIADAVIEVSGKSNAIDAFGPIARSTRTDENGGYRVADVEPGTYTIVAVPSPPPRLPSGGSVRPQWPVSVTREIVIAAGEDLLGEFLLQRRPVTEVAVSLQPPMNVTVGDDVVALVTAVEGTPPTLSQIQPLPGGRLVAALHPGRYRVDVRVTGWNADLGGQKTARAYFASVVFEVQDATSQTLALQLSESVDFAGDVVGPGSADDWPNLRLVPMFGRAPVVRSHNVAVSETGRVSARGLAPGRYRLEWSEPNAPWTLNQVRIGGRDQHELEIDLNQTRDDIQVVVEAASSLTGMIVGPAMPFGILVLVSEASASDLPYPSARVSLTIPDNKGGFVFARQRAGTYRLILLKDVDLTELMAPAFIQSLLRAPGSIRIVLVPGKASTIELKIS